MGKLHFHVIKFTPEQASEKIRPGDFPEKEAIAESRNSCSLETRETCEEEPAPAHELIDFSARAARFKGVRGGKADISVEQYFYLLNNKNNLQVFIRIPKDAEVRHCGSHGQYEDPFLLSWRTPLPEGALVAGVYTGDHNGDGFTDLLVRLSNGAAYVFEQVPGETQIGKCVPVERE